MGTIKAVVLTVLIFIITLWAALGYCYTFEMDYSGPGSEFERSMEQYRDDRNRDSWERSERGEGDERDQERAEQYRDDHGV